MSKAQGKFDFSVHHPFNIHIVSLYFYSPGQFSGHFKSNTLYLEIDSSL